MPWASLLSSWDFLLSFIDWRSLDKYFNLSSPNFWTLTCCCCKETGLGASVLRQSWRNNTWSYAFWRAQTNKLSSFSLPQQQCGNSQGACGHPPGNDALRQFVCNKGRVRAEHRQLLAGSWLVVTHVLLFLRWPHTPLGGAPKLRWPLDEVPQITGLSER